MSNGERGGRDGQFTLPRPTFGLFFPIFTGTGLVTFGGRNPRNIPGLNAFPQPVPTFPTSRPSPVPFPSGPAANDPIFRRTLGSRVPSIGGRLLGLGSLVITAAEILVAVIEKIQVDQLGDILDEQARQIASINIDAILTRAALEKALRVEKQVRALEQAPETLEQPIGDPLPAPAPQITPAVIPGTFPSLPGAFPVALPTPIGLPGPVAPTSPRPVPLPAPAPLPVPGTRTFPVGFPLQLPVFDPLFSPVGDPQFLTPPEATPLQFATPGPTSQFSFFPDPRLDPQLAPETNPDQRCKNKCDDQENRTQCFKGLYRESTNAINFTEWTEVDCRTGREIESTGVAGSIASNVVELF